MAAIQLNFTLRTSSNCKTVHLLGSWDNYNGQLPLSKDAAKAGAWKGTFRFQGSMLQQGQRYWYYYIIDGYHVSHDPAREHTTEPTTGRKLNILDIPNTGAAPKSSSSTSSKRASRRMSVEVPKGRALSPSKIQSPKPMKPNETKKIVEQRYSSQDAELARLSKRFSRHQISQDESSSSDFSEDSDNDSEISDSSVPSLSSSTSRSSQSSSPSSVSSRSSCCTCERYGITRAGDRVKLDCGGARCGSDGSECSSEDEEYYNEKAKQVRRQGIVVKS